MNIENPTKMHSTDFKNSFHSCHKTQSMKTAVIHSYMYSI